MSIFSPYPDRLCTGSEYPASTRSDKLAECWAGGINFEKLTSSTIARLDQTLVAEP